MMATRACLRFDAEKRSFLALSLFVSTLSPGCCFGGETETPVVPANTTVVAPPTAAVLRPVFAESEVETSDEPRARLVVVGARASLYGPPGTTAVIDGRTLTVPASGPAEETLDAAAYIAGLGVEVRPGSGSTLPELRAHDPVTRAVTITRPGMAPSSGTLTMTDRPLLAMFAAHFAAVQSGPVVVPEGSGLGALRLHVSDEATTLTGVVGFVLSPGDVGAVVIVRTVTREGPCGTYVRADGVESSIHWYADDLAVRIHERATGRVVAERTFRASQPRCAGTIQSSPHTYADDAAVDAFITANLPPPPAATADDSDTSTSAGTPIDPRLTMAAISGRLAPLGITVSAQPASDSYGYSMEVALVFDAESRAFQLMLARLNDATVGGEPHAFVFGDRSFTHVYGDGPMTSVRALATELGSPATQAELAEAIARADLSAVGPNPGIFVVGGDIVQQWSGARGPHFFNIERYDLAAFAGFGRGGRTVVMLAPLTPPVGPEIAATNASAARIMAALAR
jgi:hypothetical protein